MIRLLKNIIKFSPIIFLIYCSKSERSLINSTGKDSVSNINKVNYNPVFLGLSPHMTDKDYNLQIKTLNKDGVLEGSNFIIDDNDELYTFNISKTSNSIRLEFNDFITVIKSPDESEDPTQEINPNYELEKNQILKIFNKKYKKANVQLSKNIDFSKFNLTLDDYTVYKDSDKYVILGYSMPNTNSNNFNLIRTNSKGDKLFGSDAMASKSNDFVSYEYGLRIQIDYLGIDDMDKILKHINLETKTEIENKRKQKEAKFNLERIHKNNIKNL